MKSWCLGSLVVLYIFSYCIAYCYSCCMLASASKSDDRWQFLLACCSGENRPCGGALNWKLQNSMHKFIVSCRGTLIFRGNVAPDSSLGSYASTFATCLRFAFTWPICRNISMNWLSCSGNPLTWSTFTATCSLSVFVRICTPGNCSAFSLLCMSSELLLELWIKA